MNQHFSEADLLETYYTQPGESMPVMMHLAECGDCAARYERLERKIRGLAACDHDEKPETFWARQRISILRKIEKQQPVSAPAAARITRVAAAAAFVLLLGGSVMTWQRSSEVATPAPTATMTTASAAQPQQSTTATEIVSVPSDPWDSEELDEFGSLVAWESWEDSSAKGGKS